VIHLPGHRDRRSGGGEAHRLHVGATRLLLRLAEQHPTIDRFVLASSACVYRYRPDEAGILREDVALDLSPSAPQFVRDRAEADVLVCARTGLSDTRIAVLRLAEVLAADMGSQLWAWLQQPVCLRPLGQDPMVEVLTIEDAADALVAAVRSDEVGAFNVPGADVLPLSALARRFGRTQVELPGPLVAAAYRVHEHLLGGAFRWDLNRWRFQVSGVLDGGRARDLLGYTPSHPYPFPRGTDPGAAPSGGPTGR
jgi:UDP-glucose 4-epimerase